MNLCKEDVAEEIITVKENKDENKPIDLSNVHGPAVTMSNEYLTGPLEDSNLIDDVDLSYIRLWHIGQNPLDDTNTMQFSREFLMATDVSIFGIGVGFSAYWLLRKLRRSSVDVSSKKQDLQVNKI